MLGKEKFRYDLETLRAITMLPIIIGHCFAIYGVWDTALLPVTSVDLLTIHGHLKRLPSLVKSFEYAITYCQ